MDPLSGCGQSPPFSPRDGCADAAASWSAKGYASVFPGAPARPFLMGKAPQRPAFPRDTPKIRRANSEALLPRRGKQRRSRTPAASPCPCGARQRRPTHAFAGGRPLLVGLPPSAPAATPSEPQRSAPAPARGAGACLHGPKALEAGTAGGAWGLGGLGGAPRHESPPGFSHYMPVPPSRGPRPAKQSAHRGRTAPSAVYYPHRPQKQPARVGTRTVKECRNRFPLTSEQPSPADGTGCRGRGSRGSRRSAL